MKRVAVPPQPKITGRNRKVSALFLFVQIDPKTRQKTTVADSGKGSITHCARVALYRNFGVRLLKPPCSVPTCPHPSRARTSREAEDSRARIRRTVAGNQCSLPGVVRPLASCDENQPRSALARKARCGIEVSPLEDLRAPRTSAATVVAGVMPDQVQTNAVVMTPSRMSTPAASIRTTSSVTARDGEYVIWWSGHSGRFD